MTLSDFYFKKLGKMISDPDYDLNERYAPRLLDAGYIEHISSYQSTIWAYIDYSYYRETEEGKKAYEEWKRGK